MSNSKYTEEEDKKLNQRLKRLQDRAKRLIFSDYYDHVRLSDLQHSILKQITNAESHYNINYILWNSNCMEQTLDYIAEKIKIAKREDRR